MEKYDKIFLDKCPSLKTSMLVFEQGHLSWKKLSRVIFASVNCLSRALFKENLSYYPLTLPRKTCQGNTCQRELASVYSQQVFLDKGTCQGLTELQLWPGCFSENITILQYVKEDIC